MRRPSGGVARGQQDANLVRLLGDPAAVGGIPLSELGNGYGPHGIVAEHHDGVLDVGQDAHRRLELKAIPGADGNLARITRCLSQNGLRRETGLGFSDLDADRGGALGRYHHFYTADLVLFRQ
ncbi:hypothetical protein D3C86_1442600 [compost metagenome]